MNRTAEHLLSHNIKPSAQRIAIMKFLMDNPVHPTVEKIYNELLPDMPTLSRTTVYNTLKVLEANNALQVIEIDSKNAHYDGDVTPHAHFMCRCCGSIHDMPLPEGTLLKVDKMKRFDIEVIKLYYKGVCESCQEKQKIESKN